MRCAGSGPGFARCRGWSCPSTAKTTLRPRAWSGRVRRKIPPACRRWCPWRAGAEIRSGPACPYIAGGAARCREVTPLPPLSIRPCRFAPLPAIAARDRAARSRRRRCRRPAYPTIISAPAASPRVLLSEVTNPRRIAPVDATVYGYHGPRKTILITDDDPTHRDLLREVLAPLGFILLSAPDGPACLALAQHCHPDLFLLDISMAGMDGWTMAETLRSSGHHQARILMASISKANRIPFETNGLPTTSLGARPARLTPG